MRNITRRLYTMYVLFLFFWIGAICRAHDRKRSPWHPAELLATARRAPWAIGRAWRSAPLFMGAERSGA